MPWRVQPARIDEVTCAQPDALGLLVHLADEAVARHYPACQRLGRIVAGVEEKAVEELADRQALARTQAHHAWHHRRHSLADENTATKQPPPLTTSHPAYPHRDAR